MWLYYLNIKSKNIKKRDEIPPIDKGRAYKLRLDTIKKNKTTNAW